MANLLIEIRCEELPVGMIAPALTGLRTGILILLKNVPHGTVHEFSTPRRICVVVDDVAEQTSSSTIITHGPTTTIAKDAQGNWTPAAVGFARKHGLTVDDLIETHNQRGDLCVAVQATSVGESVVQIFERELEELVLSIPFKRSMSWYDPKVRWGRPIRQVVALYGEALISTMVAGVATTDAVTGHRLSNLPPVKVTTAEQYVAALKERHVLADRSRREQAITDGLLQLAFSLSVDFRLEGDLLDEITDLVEWPVPLAVTFAEELLQLPARLLMESMRVNQRMVYTTRGGQLTNIAFTVSNNPHGDKSTIAEGNRRVLAARFYDAQFFYAEDRKKSLEEHAAGLSKMRWIVGTMQDKQSRVSELAQLLASCVQADPAAAREAGARCKSDLLTLMVGEFPNLQGHMARLYAEGEGMDIEVALALEEHYLPRHQDDQLPSSPVGVAVGLADRLDTIVQCFRADKQPKSDGDPLGLRRAAQGVVALLGMSDSYPSIGHVVGLAGGGERVCAFIVERLRSTLKDEGHATEIVNAVLASGCESVWEAKMRVKAIEACTDLELAALVVTSKRLHNATSKATSGRSYDRQFLLEPACSALVDAYEATPPQASLEQLLNLFNLVHQLFEDVLVFSGDESEHHKLAILRVVGNLFSNYAEFRIITTW